MNAATTEHAVTIETDGYRYPYRAVCICGYRSLGYAAPHAAQDMAQAHLIDSATETG